MAQLVATRCSTATRSGARSNSAWSCGSVRPVVSASRTGASSISILRTAQPQARVAARSIPVSGPGAPAPSGGVDGQVTSALMQSMQQKISEALEADRCSVSDLYGDGRHVTIDVVSKLFDGKNSMQRQRMVYKAIWLELQEAVHAVDSMSTKTPAEAGL